MDRNEKIVAIATASIAVGTAALFAIKRVRAARTNQQMDEEMHEHFDAVKDKNPANN
jgi:hypothetical protein